MQRTRGLKFGKGHGARCSTGKSIHGQALACRQIGLPGRENPLRAKTNFASQINLIWLFKTLGENISLFPKPKSVVSCARPAPTGGALRDRHGRRERDAMDAVVA
jgi:hypothetical protein